MKSVFDHNVDLYNKGEEHAYTKKRGHQLRFFDADAFIRDELKKIEKNPTGIKLLSVGCGLGDFEQGLLKRYKIQVYGIDGAKESVDIAGQKGLKAVQGNFEDTFPYSDSEFDIVFAGEVIEHIMSVKEFLSEVYRVLKPSGIFVLTTPNLARLDDRFKFLFGRSPRHVAPMHDYLYLHIHPFTWISLRDALKTYGFGEFSLKSNFVQIYPVRLLQVRWLAKLFPTLGASLVVKARKM